MDSIAIYVARNEIEATFIKGLLVSAGIATTISSNNSVVLRYGALTNQPYDIFVRKEDSEKALQILREQGTPTE